MSKKKTAVLVITEDRQGKFRWRYVAANGDVLHRSTQGYTRRRYCRARAVKCHPGVPTRDLAYGEK